MRRTLVLEQFRLLFLADDIDEAHAVFEADAVEHLAEVRRTDGVQDRLLAIHLGILDKAQRGHRIDEARGACFGAVIAQRQAHRGIGDRIFGKGGAGDAGDALAHQRLGHVAVAGGHDGAGTLIAGGQALAMACFLPRIERLGHLGDDLAWRIVGILEIGRAGQDREVRGVDRRGFHLDQHLVAGGIGKLALRDLDGQRTVAFKSGEKLLSGSGHLHSPNSILDLTGLSLGALVALG